MGIKMTTAPKRPKLRPLSKEAQDARRPLPPESLVDARHDAPETLQEWAERTAPTLDDERWRHATLCADPHAEVWRQWDVKQARALLAVLDRIAGELTHHQDHALRTAADTGVLNRRHWLPMRRLVDKVGFQGDDTLLVLLTPLGRAVLAAARKKNPRGHCPREKRSMSTDDRNTEPADYRAEEESDDYDPPIWRVRIVRGTETCWLSGPDAIAAAWAHRDRIAAEALREAAEYCGPTQHITYAELLVRADALDPPKGPT